MSAFTESAVEEATLAWLEILGYAVPHGSDIAAGEPGAERSDPNYRDLLLERRLCQAQARRAG
jgi:type I restriction enzyme R subunit